MYYQPTPISWQHYHFLIMSAPDDHSMKKCLKVIPTRPDLTRCRTSKTTMCRNWCEPAKKLTPRKN